MDLHGVSRAYSTRDTDRVEKGAEGLHEVKVRVVSLNLFFSPYFDVLEVKQAGTHRT